MDLIRSFIAIHLSSDIKDRLENIIYQVKTSIDSPVRWVPIENIHLTLKFLGEITRQQLDEVTGILINDIDMCHSFELSVGTLGAFPNLHRPRVIWAGVKAPQALFALQREIDEKCVSAGIAQETREFSPHLTLGRVNRDSNAAQLSHLSETIKLQNNVDLIGTMQVKVIDLYMSELSRSGAKYSCLAEKKLSS